MRSGLSGGQLEAIFDATPVALLVFDSDLTMVYANNNYLRAVGMPLEAIAGRYVFDVFPDSPDRHGASQAAALQAVMRDAVDLGEQQVLSEYRYDIPTAGGGFDQRIWNVTEVPVLEPDGTVGLVLHYTEDVTDLVHARTERQRVARKAEALSAGLERAHEKLRTAASRDRSIAETLQRALLGNLPAPESLRLHAGYRPAADQVGGDWYDAITRPGGATTVMIGDVEGHDIQAASVMGELRNMLRALAWAEQATPSSVLSQLDRAMAELQIRTLATALVATVQPQGSHTDRSCEVTFTNAGHPPPVLVTADGQVDVLHSATHDILLGVNPEAERHDSTVTLEPGAQLVLYTDGLIESRGSTIDQGLDRLIDVVLRHHDDLAHVDQIITDVAGEHPTDDAAMLVVENPRH